MTIAPPRRVAAVVPDRSDSSSATPKLTLIVRRRIRASAVQLFSAWTEPAQLKLW